MNRAVSTFAEPFTPRGVAAFACAPFMRLLLAQFIVAALAAISMDCLFYYGYFPTMDAAIKQLPPQGEIRFGKLNWRGEPSQLIAEGRLIAFDVDLAHSGQIHSTADLQVEFGKNSIRIFSLFNYYTEFEYPPYPPFPLNQTDLQPVWDAWKPDILGITAAMVIIGLILIWGILAAIYFLPAWLICFFANRDLNLRQSWKLCGAALMPGALIFIIAIFLYAFGAIGLIQFCFSFGAHFVLGWIYLAISAFFVPRTSGAPAKGNPFSKNE